MAGSRGKLSIVASRRRTASDAARLGGLALVAGLVVGLAAVPAGAARTGGQWSFFSAPDLHPTRVRVLKRRPGLAQGYFLTTSQAALRPHGPSRGPATGEAGPLLLDSRGRPVWFLPLPGEPFGLQQEAYRGRPVLVWFQGGVGVVARGRPSRGVPNAGRVMIYDERYRRIAAIAGRHPWSTDLHDASIIGPDIWITVTRLVRHQDLTRYGGPGDAIVQDVGLQEFQISTGRLIRTWDALNPRGRPNIPLSESRQRASQSWDPYHLNSVQALLNGDLLISMRNTWSVYLLDPRRDRILWTLGGRASTFRVAPAARFAWQHDARLVRPAQGGRGREVELTLFDDNTGRGQARGLIVRLNTVTRRAGLVASYPHRPPFTAVFLGSMQLLPNGNALVDWGSPYAYFTEFSASGRQLLNAAWPYGTQSYRTLFTDTWVGLPSYPPSAAVRGQTVYASWNGATRVARWEVMAGPAEGRLRVVASRARLGFETAIRLKRPYAAYRVRALNAVGAILGTSKSLR